MLLRWVLGYFPEFVESVYSRGLFVVIRWGLDHSIGLLPFPFSYLLALLTIAWLLVQGFRAFPKHADRPPLKVRLWGGLHRVGSFLGAGVFFFFWLWGFNYLRVPVAEKLELELVEPWVPDLERMSVITGELAAKARNRIEGATPADSLLPDQLGPDLELRVRTALKAQLAAWDYPSGGNVRARLIAPGGWMLRLNVAGIYNPFTGEGNVSTALIPAQIPHTMGHELSHGYGFGDEGTCNFLSAVACSESTDPVLQYGGFFALWRYVSYELRRMDADAYKTQFEILDAGMKADIEAARRNSRRYQGVLSNAGEKVNDAYLKVQGVEGGIENYNRVVLMYLAWYYKINHPK